MIAPPIMLAMLVTALFIAFFLPLRPLGFLTSISFFVALLGFGSLYCASPDFLVGIHCPLDSYSVCVISVWALILFFLFAVAVLLRKRKRGQMVFLVLAFAGVVGAIYMYAAGKERWELERRSHQIKDVVVACTIYASNHRERYPTDLQTLSDIYGTGSLFLTRVINELELVSPRAHPSNNPEAVLVREIQADDKGRRMVGYQDGHMSMMGADGRPIDSKPRKPL